ncbi:MAG: PDZ domain-containing protein [Actinobacteria bacterium]|nr:MAG: PDZ domain-containing protein [Actinomycetota bacterium]
MSGRRPTAAAVLAAAALSLGACGGGSDSGTTVASPGSQKTVVVQSHNGAFDPEAIYQAAAPEVVTIRSILPGGGPTLLGGGGGGSQAEGSGFVISSDGEIATAAHVVTDAQSGGGAPIHAAKEVYAQFADRNQVAAKIVGYDPQADVALLKVDPNGLDLHPLQLGNSDTVRTGESVAAIGSPFLQEQSLSVGIVSATDRSIPSLTDFQIEGGIQTDASINPGNSGGPLLDADGRVIGVNEQINTTSGGNEGVAFAVPIGLVKRSLDQLRANGSVKYAYIGVTTQTLYPQLAGRLGLPVDTGALVTKVIKGAPADSAGIQAGTQQVEFQGLRATAGGDVIVAVDGHKIVGETDLPELIAQHDPGDTVTLEIIRDGKTQNVDVKLGERPQTGH